MPHFANMLLTLLTLVFLEIVLGIDNLIFLAILSQRLPEALQKQARRTGLLLAWITRLGLLAMAVYLTTLVRPVITVLQHPFSVRDLFLLCGGIFLMLTTSQEINNLTKHNEKQRRVMSHRGSFISVVMQIALFDIIFSLDSVLTAVGVTQQFWLMALAISIAIIFMITASEPLSAFMKRYSFINLLALIALLIVAMTLIGKGLGVG